MSEQFLLADSMTVKANFDSSNVVLRQIAKKSLKDSSYTPYLKALNKIAGNYSDMGKYDSMKIVLNHVLNFAQENLDSINLSSAQANFAYGGLYLEQNKFDSAKIYLNRALYVRKKIMDENSPEIGDVYNVLGNIEFYRNNNQKALHFYHIALKYMLNRGFYNKSVGIVYMNLGNIYDNLYHFEIAKSYLDTAFTIESRVLDKSHPILAQIEINKMSSFANSGELDSAINAGNNALEILSIKFGKDHPYIGMIYNNLGLCYASYGDNQNALTYFEKASVLLGKINSNIQGQLTKAYGGFGNIYRILGDYNKAVKYFEKALDIIKTETNNNIYESSQYKKNLALSYVNAGFNGKAIKTIEEAIKDWQTADEINNIEFAKTKAFYADVLNKTGKYRKAEKVAEDMISFFKDSENINYLFYSYSQLSESYLNQKKYKSSLDIYSKLLEYFPSSKSGEIVNTEKIISYYELEGHIISILSSAEKSAYELYKQTKSESYLDKSQEISEILMGLFFENYDKILIESSKFLESKRFKEEINIAMIAANAKFVVSHTKKNFEYALKLAEFNKSITLLESLTEKSALSKISIPEADIKHLQKLKSSINFFLRQLSSDEATKADSTEISYYKNKLFDLRNEFKNYKTELSNKYPQLNVLVKIDLNISVDSIRNSLLDTDRTAIEYYLDENELYIFGISQNDYFIIQKKVDENLKQEITSLLNAINNSDKEKYILKSNEIYKEIFAEIDSKIKTDRVLIITDGELGFVPFDALLYKQTKSETDYRDMPYLIRKYSIGYAYSFNILEKINRNEEVVSNFLGLAPFNTPKPEIN